MVFRTVNKDIACSPFPTHAIEPAISKSGFITAAPRATMCALTVRAEYMPLDLQRGDVVFVPLEFANSVWGKRRISVLGLDEFILVPAEQVCVIQKHEQARPLPTREASE